MHVKDAGENKKQSLIWPAQTNFIFWSDLKVLCGEHFQF